MLQFSSRQVGEDITVADLAGRLTLGNRLLEVEHAVKELIEKGSRKLVLDMSKLEFMDSAGIGMVMLCAGLIQEAGGRMRIACAEGHVEKVLKLTHVHEVVPLHPTLSACLEGFDTLNRDPQP